MAGNVSEFCYQSNAGGASSYERFSFLTGGCLTSALVVLGVFGNGYSVLMLRKFRIAPALYYYLGTLAIWDSLLLICAFVYLSLGCLLYGALRQCSSLAVAQRIFHPISHVTMTASVWLVVLIAVERFRAVSDPIKHRIRDSEFGTKIACVVASAGAVVYSLPSVFEVDLTVCKLCDRKTNITYEVPGIIETPLRRSTSYQLVYRFVGALVFESLIPFVLILVLTIRILRYLRIANRTRSKMQPSGNKLPAIRTAAESAFYRNREAGSTIMLLLVLVKFLTCHIPTILNIWEILVMITGQGQSTDASWAFTYSVDISNFLIILNSATNWVIYFRWRHSLKRGPRWNPTGAALLATFSHLLVQPGSMLVMRNYDTESRSKTFYETVANNGADFKYTKRPDQNANIGVKAKRARYGATGGSSDNPSCSELFARIQSMDEKTTLITTAEYDLHSVSSV